MMINPMSPQRAAALTALQQAARPMRPMEIAAATGMKYSNVAMMLLRMRTDGQAEHSPCGRWKLTALGTADGGVRRTFPMSPPT